MTDKQLRDWVRGHLALLTGMAPETIAFDRTLGAYGLDSVDAVLMAGELEEALGVEIDPAAFIQFDTFEEMIAALGAKIRNATSQ